MGQVQGAEPGQLSDAKVEQTSSDELVGFIKSYERGSDKNWLTARDLGDGEITFGYGSTIGNHPEIKEGDTITEEQADGFLRKDLETFEKDVRGFVTKPMTQNEFDSIVSLTYNSGRTKVAKSKAIAAFNAGNKSEFEFEAFDRNAGFTKSTNSEGVKAINEGLVSRKSDELEIFRNAVYDTAFRDGRKKQT
jgi:lysozyme